MLKRKSLAELQQEDEKLEEVLPAKQSKATASLNKISEIINNKSEKPSKADFVKMSITVEPEIFDAVEDLSRKRRRNKQPFTFSAIIRDALKEYLNKPEGKG
jgi:hypothetical protein